ncbi:MAG: hypothetical protein ABSD57_08450 [Verrucomicrobiota bacterium]|jgi:hypothetical protein
MKRITALLVALALGMTVAWANNLENPCISKFSTNCLKEGSVSLTTVTFPGTNVCLSNNITASTGCTVSNALVQVVDANHCVPPVTNQVPPVVLTNRWAVSGVGATPSSGSGLSATFMPTTAGNGTVTFYCTYSNPPPCHAVATVEAETNFVVVMVEINLAKALASDGESVNADLIVTPATMTASLSDAHFTATKPDGSTDFDNPAHQGITLSKRGASMAQWQIDNVRWYSTQADQCNDTGDHRITATVQFGGLSCVAGPVLFTADTSTINGKSEPTQYFDGNPTYTTTSNTTTGKFETTVAQGTFVRSVRASATWTVAANSQFHDMVVNEEIYHRDNQLQNASHPIVGTYYRVERIMAQVTAGQPYIGATAPDSEQAARDAFAVATTAEINRGSAMFVYPSAERCSLESEAKNAAGSSHRFKMKCAYPACP